MTVTKAFKDQVASVTDTNADLRTLDETKWKETFNQSSPANQRTVYTFDAGSPAYKTELDVSASGAPLNGKPARRFQNKLIGTLVATDSETTLTSPDGRIEVWMGAAVTADATVTEAMVAAWFEQLFRSMFPTITAGACVTDRVGTLLRGNSRIIA